jgi:predicted HTH domain antitoxin
MKLLEAVKFNDKSNLKALVDSGLYASEDDVIHDALEHLLEDNPDSRLKIAIYRYQNEEISLGKAAEIAGVCWEDMKRILMKNGIQPRLGPETIEEAREEYLTLERFLNERKRNSK